MNYNYTFIIIYFHLLLFLNEFNILIIIWKVKIVMLIRMFTIICNNDYCHGQHPLNKHANKIIVYMQSMIIIFIDRNVHFGQ